MIYLLFYCPIKFYNLIFFTNRKQNNKQNRFKTLINNYMYNCDKQIHCLSISYVTCYTVPFFCSCYLLFYKVVSSSPYATVSCLVVCHSLRLTCVYLTFSKTCKDIL